MTDSGFCVECGHHVESFDGLNKCPNCESFSTPCHDDMQVQISINWHELHILCVWAENYARENDLQNTVFTIAKRIQDQHPTLSPLTLAAELGEVAKQFEDIDTNDSKLTEDMNRFKLGEHG